MKTTNTKKTLHVKKGDNVTVLTGKDKGKKGVILAAFPQTGKIIIEGINIVKRSMKARTANSTGQVIEKPAPVDASNVKLSEKKVKKNQAAKKLK